MGLAGLVPKSALLVATPSGLKVSGREARGFRPGADFMPAGARPLGRIRANRLAGRGRAGGLKVLSASPKVWMDAYLAACAITSGLRLVSLDRDFKSYEAHGLDLLQLNP